MQHKLLLGSTALVSAGLLLSGGAQAQETRVGGIEVVLGGYTEFGAKAATRNTLRDTDNAKKYLFFMDNEVFINANGVTEGGIQYGSRVELEVGSGDGNEDDAFVDEVGLFFSGGFGRFELGKEDGAEDVMAIGGQDAQAGTGGIDGDTSNLFQPEMPDTDDDTKISYFTPRVAGFQLGASFVPDTGDGFSTDQDGQFHETVGAGVNWVGALGPADLTVSGVGILGQGQTGDTDDLASWAAGALAGFGGLSFGGQIGQNTDFNEGDFANAGIKFGFGAANASVGWNVFDPQGDTDGDTNHVFVVSGDLGLMPGVTLKGDVSYATDDPGAREDPDDPDDTIAGVVTIQLDY
jgi:outer membrane protein OmpU